MAYNRNKKSTEQQVVESVLKGTWWIIKLPFKLFSTGKKSKKKSKVDRAAVQAKWSNVESLLGSNDSHKIAQAVMNADKLLDSVLKESGVRGETMGERLKASEKFFPTRDVYQGAWDGHKLRNQIAHEVDLVVSASQGREAISKLKKAIFSLI